MTKDDKGRKRGNGVMIQTELSNMIAKYNLSREDIASRLGVSSMTIYRWETGKTLPKSRALIKAFEELKKDLKK